MATRFDPSRYPVEIIMPENNEISPIDYALRWQRHEAAQRQASVQNRRIVFTTLSLHAITDLRVSFNGEGDSGQIEDIAVTPEDRADLLDAEITMMTTSWPGSDTLPERAPLRNAVENVCYDALSQTHGGWENNDGAYGDIVFDVDQRTVTLEFNERYMSTEYFEHSWTEEPDDGA
ncbi:DUF6878 family protein [Acetobacter persici]|uniref:DUF6878 family protein n=1 Tax=Acetobacter persici TaxID=1076596 RepID=UPI0036DC5C14